MLFTYPLPPCSSTRHKIRDYFLADESACVQALLTELPWPEDLQRRVQETARALVQTVRHTQAPGMLEAFLQEYDLSSQEGIVLMCLAEALLRIPDAETADRLIHDKLLAGHWDQHLGHSASLWVNASTWGLMLTGGFVKLENHIKRDFSTILGQLVARSGEPLIRVALKQAMRILGHQFVMGQSIEQALQRSQKPEAQTYRYSYDMLGEAAITQDDAERYQRAYAHAIDAVAQAAKPNGDLFANPGISVKLSALHPRYEFTQRERVINELVPCLQSLAVQAQNANISLTIDAEEADRLELSLDIFAAVFCAPELRVWPGLGLAVQAYQKRAPQVLAWLGELARSEGKRIPVRLVKGAYWDSEIKRAQERGLSGYPVYTRKVNTDLAYLACAHRLLAAPESFYPQFATHNAHTVASILHMVKPGAEFEFQRLHGMGAGLYTSVIAPAQHGRPCRVYAPVGSHQDLLPYLVRRLLENGANTSFVHHLSDERLTIEEVCADPVAQVRRLTQIPHPQIPLPKDLYGSARRNSDGLSLSDIPNVMILADDLQQATEQLWQASSVVDGHSQAGTARARFDPSDQRREIGTTYESDSAVLDKAIAVAAGAAHDWNATPAEQRAKILEQAADLIDQERATLMAMCIREGGKTLTDAQAELREAIDYCRYYALLARQQFAHPLTLPGPTGECNELHRQGRGIFACISPWNFPLAIFTGQITAALAAGNSVIAKPASQTPLIAHHVVQLLHQAGVPQEALHLLLGSGQIMGQRLAADPRIAGIAFTGSTETAWTIQQTLAARRSAIVPFIAETGGQNAMIVDSSALPEQVVNDVLMSAFNSAGQRCSALRVLFLQKEIAERIIALLAGAMAELRVGDPALLSTDIGPLIDQAACKTLAQHAERLHSAGRLIYQTPLPADLAPGCFFAPQAFELDNLSPLTREVFGPMLHIIRYEAHHLDQVIDAINNTGYGLTLGIHTRIDETALYIQNKVRAGNVYVNRSMIGAVVGVQPFGGSGLSGTGPKAGGPHYLARFSDEKTVSTNIAAAGGNTSLMSLK